LEHVKHRPDCLGFAEASGPLDRGAIGQRATGPTPGTVIRRRHTSSSRTMASKRRCRVTSARAARRTMSSGSTRTLGVTSACLNEGRLPPSPCS